MPDTNLTSFDPIFPLNQSPSSNLNYQSSTSQQSNISPPPLPAESSTPDFCLEISPSEIEQLMKLDMIRNNFKDDILPVQQKLTDQPKTTIAHPPKKQPVQLSLGSFFKPSMKQRAAPSKTDKDTTLSPTTSDRSNTHNNQLQATLNPQSQSEKDIQGPLHNPGSQLGREEMVIRENGSIAQHNEFLHYQSGQDPIVVIIDSDLIEIEKQLNDLQ